MAQNNLLYAYYCGRCQSKLRESPLELAPSPSDLCPQCGSFLTDTLQLRQADKNTPRLAPTLRPASDLAGPTFGIPALDALVGKFATSVCLTGEHIAETLFWRAIVHSLMPRRAGGSGFSRILLIDAGNCSDIYLCVDYARQYGLGLDKLLDSIVVTRAFTVYQLAALSREAGDAAMKYGADMVAMADMNRMFVTDPRMQGEEARLAGRIADGLAAAAAHAPVLAFVSSNGSSEWLVRFNTTVAVMQEQGHIVLSARSGRTRRSASISEQDVMLVVEA